MLDVLQASDISYNIELYIQVSMYSKPLIRVRLHVENKLH